MSAQISFDHARSAVLGMDYQAGIVSIYTKGDEAMLTRAAKVLRQARLNGMLVIHIQVGFRPGLPEVSSRNLLFAAIKSSAQHQRLFQGESGAIHSAVAPEAEEIVITKHRVNAFAGTDLEIILRARDIDTLIMFGIATSSVVLSTLLHASDSDFRVFVISDCCADLDEELHTCLLDKFFPRRATVLTTEQFVSALAA